MNTFIPLLIGASVIALSVSSLIILMSKRNIRLTWYEWLIGSIGLLFVILAAQHFFGAMSELFPYAAWMGLLIIGLPGAIILTFTWQLVMRRNNKTKA
ncbi:dehalogenase [Dehalococcoides mccartyi]|uniref:dehalogenase n=1 Tax=Dehalococcoides mccartyi TaxID=61435 RepID=UPI000805AE93|nr:dehalogenase [Dehalococcoides mccartyi]OBW61069.1 MAG: dehalogenase [Dehalococcoides mccartyi]OBW62560.1 MAG: dehalogenase [Dehalococcoides mccartyi]